MMHLFPPHGSLTLTSLCEDQRSITRNNVLDVVITMSNWPLEPAQSPHRIALSG